MLAEYVAQRFSRLENISIDFYDILCVHCKGHFVLKAEYLEWKLVESKKQVFCWKVNKG